MYTTKTVVNIPADWPYEHIPTWEYDKDGDIEVSNFMCRQCKYFGSHCKCIDHRYVYFSRPWFSCDKLRENHPICKAFKPYFQSCPAGYLEWEALGGFDEWYRLWRKQWHHNRNPVWTHISLIRAIPTIDAEHDIAKDREFSDDVYTVPYEDFLNCDIVREDGIHCLDFRHIEYSRNSKSVTGYKWVSEGPGIWIPWDSNKYIKAA